MIPLKDDVPTDRVPVVTVALIALNAAVFLWQLSIGLDYSVQVGGAIPYEILMREDVGLRDVVPPPWTIFTSMFMHGGFGHIGMNMLTLWIFGNNVEDALGRGRFVAFYLAAGIVAALAQTVATALSGDLYAIENVPMVGASGAIAGVLAAYLVLFPRARILTVVIIVIFVQFVHLPASFFIVVWFGLQLASIVFGGSPGVAVMAHVGGFVAGYLLVRVIGRRPQWRARRVSW